MGYFQPEIECASREEIRRIQSEKLVKQVKHVWDNVPYYRKKMEEKGVTPDDIKSVDDLPKLPFLSKDDFKQRTKCPQAVIDKMADMGLLGDIPDSNQISIFDLMK